MDENILAVTFKNSRQQKLAGRLHLPYGYTKAFAVFSPCFTCGKDVHAARRISQGLAERGIATLRLDFTGLGDSEGEFEDTNFSTMVDDLLAAAKFLETHYRAPEIFIGHSLGGTAAIVAASRYPHVKAVSTINSPCHPKHVAHHFKDLHDQILWTGEADVDISGRTFKIRKHFLEDLEAIDMTKVFSDLKAALLVFHAPGDTIVNIKNASYIFELAHHPKSFISLDAADHLIRDRKDGDFIAASILAWSTRYINFMGEATLEVDEGVVKVIETDEGLYTNRVYTGKHILRADEPLSVEGGLGTGPSPYDYILVALGSCTSMTLRMYANLKGIPLVAVKVDLTHKKIHGTDCKDCPDKNRMIDVITRDIELVGELTTEQRAKLLEIANKCPVHRTLQGEVQINSSLKGE